MRLAFAALYLASSVLVPSRDGGAGAGGGVDAFAFSSFPPRFGGAPASAGGTSAASQSRRTIINNVRVARLGMAGAWGEDVGAAASEEEEQIGDSDTGIMGDMEAPKFVAEEGGEEDEYQGGERFKSMMEAAKAGGGTFLAAAAIPPPPPPPPPQAGSALVLHPGWSPVADAATGKTYYYNQLTGETTWDAPLAASSAVPPPPPPPPPPGAPPVQGGGAATAAPIPTLEEQFIKGVKGKRREFDVIANTADIYLAQLKRDSTIRSIARREGDLDFANDAFGDESIKELEGWVEKNPHLEEKQTQYAMIGTPDENEFRFEEQYGHLDDDERDSYTGISYKQRMDELKEAREKGGKGGAEEAVIPPPAEEEPTEPVAEEPAPVVEAEEEAPVVEEEAEEEEEEEVVAEVEAPPPPPAIPPPPATEEEEEEEVVAEVEAPPPPPATPPPPPVTEEKEEVVAEVEAPPPPPATPPPPPPPAVQSEVVAAEEETETVAEVEVEAEAVQSEVVAAEEEAEAEEPTPLPDPEPLKVNAEAESVAATPEPTSDDEASKIRTLRTLMGLLLKHRGGPGFGKGILKGPEADRLERTLEEASSVLREEAGMDAAVAEEVAVPAAPKEEVIPIAPSLSLEGTFACVEGAVAQYRSAGESSLPDVRNAFLMAINSINRVLAEGGLDETGAEATRPVREEFPSAPPTASGGAVGEANAGMGFPDSYAVTEAEVEAEAEEAPAMGFPDSYAVAEPDVAEPEVAEAPPQPAVATAGGDDPNTALLRGAYETLQSLAGEEKFGLKDLGGDEAAKLGDALVDARGVLLEELEKGIPAGTTAATDQGSMYKEKLAQAKEAKAALKGNKNP
eukprot:CAMPEP_0113574854 /NCGR_PEP_ID=MMETSP0015_2-20120614/27369_1 /TAXON_ID=2838 /ORGANISM="Odontella" /LENGTH=850 /DNA_ID=CAMNT_0000478019 /DNA_START=262 /DNA_END=2815 /DNA_ORIENTATION=- /assembly_acc=CAM_ASM_000160